MKKTWTLAASVAALTLLAGLALAHEGHDEAAPKADARFEMMKTLVGQWEGKREEGRTTLLTYRLTAGGSAIEEVLGAGTDHEMVTMYFMDGDRMMLTHYCAARNQPRMAAGALPEGGKALTFTFVDATNLANPTDGHMHGLVLAMKDADHITQTWTWQAEGKSESMEFSFTRKKS